jgi:small subunit ribosomal protein S11
MRISGITIPDEKHLSYALTEVFGIGLSRSKDILDELSIEHTTKAADLSTDQENAIREKVESFTIEGELKRQVSANIKRLKDIDSYRGSLLTLCDEKGNAVMAASSGALGFKGSRKSTPFAAAKVGEIIGEKAQQMGMKEAEVTIRGVGAGRESALRAFAGKGIGINKITDRTPVPFNGPRAPKARRV